MISKLQGELAMLPSQKYKRNSVSAYYAYGARYLYLCGGRDSSEVGFNKGAAKCLPFCERFHVQNLKWEDLPDLNEPRSDPGTFETKCEKYLYAFLGGAKTIEVLNLIIQAAGWKYVNVEIPQRIWNTNLTMFPVFNFAQTTQILFLQDYKILMFGGNEKSIYQYNTLLNEIELPS